MIRKKLPADRALGPQISMRKKPQWRASAFAAATSLLLGLAAADANALALGRVTVQSALGEPLRAEVDIPEINADELASLRASVASPEAFRGAGLEYNSALSGLRINLERRPDGRYFLSLSSARAVNDPFIDLILETSWSSGRIVRDYTMLFDPPSTRQSPPPPVAQTAPVAPPASVSPGAVAPAPQATPQAAPQTSERRAAAPRPPASQPSPPAKPAARGDKQVAVQTGDTAGKIAAANKPPSVSLDQMLVAMLQANPQAFIGGNINRLRSGSVLDIPTAEQAEQMPAAQATQTLVAQSRDFDEFRRQLAERLPTTRVAPSDRQVSGKVQAQVEEKKTAPATPDKLTLSKGAVQGRAAEDKIARDRASQDAAVRLAELNKNLTDLNKLGAAAGAAPGGAASAARPGIAVPAGAGSGARPVASAASSARPASAPASATPAPAPAAVASAPAPALAASAASAASAPVVVAASAAPAPKAPAASAAKRPTAPPAKSSLVDDLLENPIVPATLGGVLALILGFVFYRTRQRKKTAQVDSSFLESRLQPDSFFGASGGQRVDTKDNPATGSSMVYSPSQLDAAGDVDPVAEADVYLAYGRDLQAEEILKEAMRTTPGRVAIHAKLLDIYAKRRDVKAFEIVATQAHSLTQGQGPEWEHICELGVDLDSTNALYRPGGKPADNVAAAAAAGLAAGSFGATTSAPAMQEAAPPPTPDLDLDLDLDFSIGDEEPAAHPPPEPAPSAALPTVAMAMATQPIEQVPPKLDMDFGATTVVPRMPSPPAPVAAATASAPADAPAPDDNALSFTLDDEPAATAAPAPQAKPAAEPAADSGMIEFDLGSLSLDLDSPPADQGAAPATAPAASDPLSTKLALAQEFHAIGDADGARGLAQEVLAEATGDLKAQAQRFLSELG